MAKHGTKVCRVCGKGQADGVTVGRTGVCFQDGLARSIETIRYQADTAEEQEARVEAHLVAKGLGFRFGGVGGNPNRSKDAAKALRRYAIAGTTPDDI